MKCIICRQNLYNLKTIKKPVIVRTELSMNELTKRPQTETKLNPLDMSEICCIR